MLFHKTYEQSFFIALFAHFKIGEFYDIHIDGNKNPIPYVSENDSMMLHHSQFCNGGLEFVLLHGKVRRRRSENGFWRQSGPYCDFNYGNSFFGMGKRCFSFQSDILKGRKMWEYSLYFKEGSSTTIKGYKIILRHYLSDISKSDISIQRFNPIRMYVSIKPKSNSSSSHYILRESDFIRNIEDMSDYLYQFQFLDRIYHSSLIYNINDTNELNETSEKILSKRNCPFPNEKGIKKNKINEIDQNNNSDDDDDDDYYNNNNNENDNDDKSTKKQFCDSYNIISNNSIIKINN
ncbi:hypothetical protein ACTA71_001876 [Dictyostelium dimigraforme]